MKAWEQFVERVTRRQATEEAIQQLKKEIDYLRRQNAELIADYVKNTAPLQKRIQNFIEEVSLLRQSLQKLDGEIDACRRELQSVREEYKNSFEGFVKSGIMERVDVLEKDRNGLFDRIDQLWEALEKANTELADVKRIEVLEKDRTELFRRFDQLNYEDNNIKYIVKEGLWFQQRARFLENGNLWAALGEGKKTIHFIRCIDIDNTGDLSCGPELYFPQFNEKFRCVFHTIKQIEYRAIQRDDWVILGGGGLLDCSVSYSLAINQVLDCCDNVVGWGLGHNRSYKGNLHYVEKLPRIEYEKFRLFTTRDWGYNNELRYCPCVSCMLPQLSSSYKVKRRIGVISHHLFRIKEFTAEECTNSFPVEELLCFIGESDIIITNAYHCAYWATLMGKKVILYQPFSNRFQYFKYAPVIYSGDLEADIQHAQNHPHALEECRAINQSLFQEIRELISENKK